MASPGLETAVERPDEGADAALGGALGVGERVEFVDQSFGMNPAQAMRADIELAGVVADDHGVGEQAMRPGELRVADLGAEPVLGHVARPDVVDDDPRRVGQSGSQDGAGCDQQANHLPLGDDDAESTQQCDQSRRRDLSLMILGEHEAAQFGSEMTIDAGGKGAVTVLPSGVRQRSR